MTEQHALAPGARARAFLNPRSIAMIGASGDENKIGGRPIRYLKLAGYRGPIYPINPGRGRGPGPEGLSVAAGGGRRGGPRGDRRAGAGRAGGGRGLRRQGRERRRWCSPPDSPRSARKARRCRSASCRRRAKAGSPCSARTAPAPSTRAWACSRPSPAASSTSRRGPARSRLVSQSGAFGIHMIVLARRARPRPEPVPDQRQPDRRRRGRGTRLRGGRPRHRGDRHLPGGRPQPGPAARRHRGGAPQGQARHRPQARAFRCRRPGGGIAHGQPGRLGPDLRRHPAPAPRVPRLLHRRTDGRGVCLLAQALPGQRQGGDHHRVRRRRHPAGRPGGGSGPAGGPAAPRFAGAPSRNCCPSPPPATRWT